MRRKLFTLAAGVSAVLCIGVCVLWVRSRTTTTHVGIEKFTALSEAPKSVPFPKVDWRSYFLRASRRGISWDAAHHELYDEPRGWHGFLHNVDTGPDPYDVQPAVAFLGFEYRNGTSFHYASPAAWRELTIPYWPLVVGLACLPALAIRKLVRESRHRQLGHCPACGYDLRATPDRCPECGAVPPVGPT